MQPIAADDVVAFLIEVTDGAPFNNTIDLAGPEKVRMDVVARDVLNAKRDPREVIADNHALYFGGKLNDQSLVPAGDHRMGITRFQDWLNSRADPFELSKQAFVRK